MKGLNLVNLKDDRTFRKYQKKEKFPIKFLFFDTNIIKLHFLNFIAICLSLKQNKKLL